MILGELWDGPAFLLLIWNYCLNIVTIHLFLKEISEHIVGINNSDNWYKCIILKGNLSKTCGFFGCKTYKVTTVFFSHKYVKMWNSQVF